MNAIERALETLGLAPDATPEDVKQAYRDLAKVWHPDRFPNDSRVRRKAEEKLKEINEAYEILQGYHPASRVRPRPHRGPSASPNPAEGHRTGEAPKQGSSSPPFEPSGKKEPASPAPESKSRLPRWAYIIGVILAIRFIGYLMEAPKTETRPRPPALTYAPSTQSPKQSSSPPSARPETRAGANRGESSTRDGVSDRRVSDSPADVDPQRSAPSDVNPAPRAVSPEQPRRVSPGAFTVGSTKDEVLAAQGTPTEFNDRVWKYGSSSVLFSGDRVTSWDVWPGSPLKVRMLPSQPVGATKDYFTVGSSKDEVLAVQGTPTEFNDRVWKYGSSSVFFSGDRVTSWDVWPGSPLKVRLESAKDQ